MESPSPVVVKCCACHQRVSLAVVNQCDTCGDFWCHTCPQACECAVSYAVDSLETPVADDDFFEAGTASDSQLQQIATEFLFKCGYPTEIVNSVDSRERALEIFLHHAAMTKKILQYAAEDAK